MVIKCAWHPDFFGHELDMGEKSPFADLSITHACCPHCLERMKTDFESYLASKEVPATESVAG